MALTGTDRGTGTHSTGATSFTLSPNANFAAGSWGVICISSDNAGAGGGAFSTFTVTDTLGNTWTRRISPLYDPGSASAGVEGAIFTTPQNGGTLQTGTVITVTFNNSPVAKCWTLQEVVPGAGNIVEYVTGGVNTGSATANPTVTTGSIASGDMVIGALFNEQGTGQTVTGDADTTNGSWSTQQTAEIGTTAAGQTISSQRKIVTATATQTFNPTLGVSSDVILGWIQLHEAAGAINVTPTEAVAVMAAVAPAVTWGALDVTPTQAVAVMGAAAPTVSFGVLDVIPTPAILVMGAADPGVDAGGVFVTPIEAVLTLAAAAPTVTFGVLDVVPTPAVIVMEASSPTTTFGVLDVTPDVAVLVLAAAGPSVMIDLFVTLTPAVLVLGAAQPAVSNGEEECICHQIHSGLRSGIRGGTHNCA